ncbi:hypothetical protein C8F04DRAFT_1181523 [Mycena alexandri]|uniref:Uncharacterized protein n=1 Tax=Mycena alexandri TaxID=1745969 RepID=A0AAD6T1P1_9AGAR|nr:hypothetical protein C8F04DRAFT_1181523 [Mycena alexandri]
MLAAGDDIDHRIRVPPTFTDSTRAWVAVSTRNSLENSLPQRIQTSAFSLRLFFLGPAPLQHEPSTKPPRFTWFSMSTIQVNGFNAAHVSQLFLDGMPCKPRHLLVTTFVPGFPPYGIVMDCEIVATPYNLVLGLDWAAHIQEFPVSTRNENQDSALPRHNQAAV